jgi:Flagellar biosynthesis protein, FliO
MKQRGNGESGRVGGLAGWLLERLRSSRRPSPRLALLERIALAPRQSLALVEAEGRRFLVATSPEGAPAFYALDGEERRLNAGNSGNPARIAGPRPGTVPRASAGGPARVSW